MSGGQLLSFMSWTLSVVSITDFTKIGPFVTATVTKCVSRWAATNMDWLPVEQATAETSQLATLKTSSSFRPVGTSDLTIRLLMSYIYGAPSKARNANVVYIWTYVWQR